MNFHPLSAPTASSAKRKGLRLAIAATLLCSPFHLLIADAAERPISEVEEAQAKGVLIEDQALELTRTEIGSRSVDLADAEGHLIGCGMAAGFWKINRPGETRPGSAAYLIAPTRLIQGRDELVVHFSDPSGAVKDLHVLCIREGAERNVFVGPLHAENVCAVRLPDSVAASVPGQELSSPSFAPAGGENMVSGSDVCFTGGPAALAFSEKLEKTLFLKSAGRSETAVSAVSSSTSSEMAGAPVYQLVGEPRIVEEDGKKWLKSYSIRCAGLLDAPVSLEAQAPNPPTPSAKSSASPSPEEPGSVQKFENATRLISPQEIGALSQILREHLQSEGWIVPSPVVKASSRTFSDWRRYISRFRKLPF